MNAQVSPIITPMPQPAIEALLVAIRSLEAAIRSQAQSPQAKLAYTQTEAAQVIGIDRKSLRHETQLGRIRRTYRKLYTRAEIERYLEAGMERNEFLTKNNKTNRKGNV